MVIGCGTSRADTTQLGLFGAQDLHLAAQTVTVYQKAGTDDIGHVLLFENGFQMNVGANQLFSDQAFVWLRPVETGYRGVARIDHHVYVYLDGNISVTKGKTAKTTDISQIVVEKSTSLVTRFVASGEVFVKAQNRKTAPLKELEERAIYKKATASIVPVHPKPIIVPQAMVPGIELDADSKIAVPEVSTVVTKPKEESKIDQMFKAYPVNIAGIREPAPTIQLSTEADGRKVATIIGRFYLWQAIDDEGTMLEFQADNAVLFYKEDGFQIEGNASQGVLASGQVQNIYLSGNISMTEGPRTVRADEIYYDFQNKHAIAVNAELRQFDVNRSIPIYIRADKLRQVSKNVFRADGITLTTSEFYMPQVSMTASKMVLTDLRGVEQHLADIPPDSKYDGVLHDVSAKAGEITYFSWPKIRTNFARPDVPIKRLSVGDSSSKGFSVESRWYLTRLLGLPEPDGVESDLLLDYYTKRGVGTGAEVEYERDDYFGWISSYLIKDHGEDDLGRERKNIEPEEDWRGRFTARHRQYLPYNWQATFELSYISDRNFMEYYYRDEFNSGKEQETLLHLKRLQDNWAFSILTKGRINDFQTETEEMPTVEFHQKAQSFWDHRLTYYGDTQISRLRERYDSALTGTGPEQYYTFLYSRHEVDMPVNAGPIKVVPYVAGTYGYDDQPHFSADIDNNPAGPDDSVMLGEAGVRLSTMFWNADSSIYSELWDVHGIRHIVTPHAEAVVFDASDDTVEMRDVVNVGLSQRWQTHRGSEVNPRTVDWMTLDLDATFVSDSYETSGAEKFIWNNPVVPTLTRRRDSRYGVMRDSVNADYQWRVSDTTAILSDLNYDIEDGVIQQLDVGVARYIHPDISYYLGSRYLRPVVVNMTSGSEEKGSHSFIASLTYAINERYTAMFAQEYNFEYGKNVNTELTVLRRYHRLYYGLTFKIDESRDETSVLFSLWPQGVREISMGGRKYAALSESNLED